MSYTDVETAAVVAAAPLTYESAAALADKLGKTHRSVIAKAKSLGVEYTPKAKPAKKAAESGPTKAQILATLRSRLGLTDREGDLTKGELEAILSAL
jgi:hypothetical protein